jgi:dTDP-4-amino-4,6-dideoxygalactose transaminase
VFAQYEAVGGAVAERLFAEGLCLPSGSALTDVEQQRIVEIIRSCCRKRL